MNKRRGFTLMELLVVVTIVAILSAVALPYYQRAILRSKFASMMTNAKAIAEAQEAYYEANREHTTNMDDLDIELSNDGDTTYTLFERAGWRGVKASRRDLLNGDVDFRIYNRYSIGTGTLCAANPDNPEAVWLCKDGLGGKYQGLPDLVSSKDLYRLSGGGAVEGWDMDGDGSIDVDDLTLLIDYILTHDGPLDNSHIKCLIDVLLRADGSPDEMDFGECTD